MGRAANPEELKLEFSNEFPHVCALSNSLLFLVFPILSVCIISYIYIQLDLNGLHTVAADCALIDKITDADDHLHHKDGHRLQVGHLQLDSLLEIQSKFCIGNVRPLHSARSDDVNDFTNLWFINCKFSLG